MGTIVCQGLQSCLESQLVESRTLRLRLSTPKTHFSHSLELALKPRLQLDSNTKELVDNKFCQYEERPNLKQQQTSSNPDMGGWSFLQALPKIEPIEKEKTAYVSPLAKRSCSTLSEKSLELCTENLGSETGTDITLDFSVFSLSPSPKAGEFETREQLQKPRQLLGAKKANARSFFPPPLTTMSGSESLRVMPHREDGRLIIEAIKTPSTPPFFHAERSHGRLRLSFFKDSSNENEAEVSAYEKDVSIYEEEEEEEEEEDDEDDDVFEMEEEEEENGEIDEYMEEDMDGNKMNVGGELGMEEELARQIPSRCKEEGELENKKRLLNSTNWEPFWVATS